ncbi:hypothetical protein M408DRAFT_30256 [Serendipita vermifera MAFF 305830]|uniref:F-box domain-containing protein n=1 Tax=Serendipita vermifera MAFF 305830 TaxID=933852 RepID=A0A0C3A7D7_SERVB|nr:hypothetical protein M408DRAFT_30256 [Serendipita vermifera MAFF 305830]
MESPSAKVQGSSEVDASTSCIASRAQILYLDILSAIFVNLALEDPLGILYAGAVCHQWRQVALNTPKAWYMIPHSVSSHLKYLKLYLDRSGNVPLHVEMRKVKSTEDTEAEIELLIEQKDRIQCLTIVRQYHLLRYSFPNLQKLVLDAHFLDEMKLLENSGSETVPSFSSTQFPHLRVFELLGDPPDWFNAKIWRSRTMPPLQRLALYLYLPEILPSDPCLTACADSLVSLTIKLPQGRNHSE